MVRSQKYGEYKFPGGGIERNETHAEALIREVMEETGYRLLPESINEYGYEPILVSLDCAIATNEKLLDIPEIPWTLRDLTVLQELKQNQMKG